MEKSLTIPNKKGLNLAAVLSLPDIPSQKVPTVMLLHGFKGYKEETTYTDLAEKLNQKGIASIRFDASGFGESEGTMENDYRFSNYIQDTEAVYEWLKEQDFFDNQRFAVCGQSMGAAQTIVFSSNHPEVKVAVSISPPDKVGTKDVIGQMLAKWKQQGYIDDTSSKYGDIRIPYAYAEDVLQYDFTDTIKRVTSPIAIFVGYKDDVVFPEQTLAVFEAASEPKTLFEFEEMDHFYKRDPQMLEQVNNQVVKFIEKYL